MLPTGGGDYRDVGATSGTGYEQLSIRVPPHALIEYIEYIN
jgi:hypothetical protein